MYIFFLVAQYTETVDCSTLCIRGWWRNCSTIQTGNMGISAAWFYMTGGDFPSWQGYWLLSGNGNTAALVAGNPSIPTSITEQGYWETLTVQNRQKQRIHYCINEYSAKKTCHLMNCVSLIESIEARMELHPGCSFFIALLNKNNDRQHFHVLYFCRLLTFWKDTSTWYNLFVYENGNSL